MKRSFVVSITSAMFTFFAAMPDAQATRPRNIDCAKAEAISLGMTERQVVRVLGKAYIVSFARGYVGYGWRSPNGEDRLDVTFDLAGGRLAQATVISIAGKCGGEVFARLPDGAAAQMGLSVLREHASEADLPVMATFGDIDFHLAYVSVGHNGDQSMRLAEYVPEGESLLRWRQMLAAFVHDDGTTPMQRLEHERLVSEQTGNPHFREIYLSADGSEAIVAYPRLNEDYVEYLVVRWLLRDGKIHAFGRFTRSYTTDDLEIEAFVQRQAVDVMQRAEELIAIEGWVLPDLPKNWSVTLTVNGESSGKVWVAPR